MDVQELIDVLEAAMTFEMTSVIVRSAGAVAEIRGPLTVRRGVEWVTLGHEDGAHVHLNVGGIHAVRYQETPDTNARIELLGADTSVVCHISFLGTNPARTEHFNRARAEAVTARFRSCAELERS